jgi:acyl-CoA synthetase (AMP-forming)/AMP-acid ligase II
MTIGTPRMQPGALVEPLIGRRWDPQAVVREIRQRADQFHWQGVASGDRVLLLHGNCLEFFGDLLALWSLGACAVPVDARLTPFELRQLQSAANARFTLGTESLDPAAAAALIDSGARSLDATASAIEASSRAALVDGPAATTEALVLFTSGTTGDPKGVVHTGRSLRARWEDLRASLGLGQFRRTLCLLPTHFGHGLICNSLYPWLSGSDLYLLPPFQPEAVMQLGSILDDHEITFMSSVPALWHLALKASRRPRKNTLERVICGSAPLSAHLWKQIQEWTGTPEVLNAYGITETGSWVGGTTGPRFEPEDGLIGTGWGTTIKILRSPNTDAAPGTCHAVAAGEVGYVWLKTPGLMRGYLGRDDLTDAVVRDGWFSTHDLGYVDLRGRLYLTGRDREEINRGGLKIYPADIDAVVERHAAVLDVCAFGVDHPTYGQEAAMAVALAHTDANAVRTLYDLMARHLAPHQLPQRWYLVEAIPRSSRGKRNRKLVADTCAGLVPLNLRGLLHDR